MVLRQDLTSSAKTKKQDLIKSENYVGYLVSMD